MAPQVPSQQPLGGECGVFSKVRHYCVMRGRGTPREHRTTAIRVAPLSLRAQSQEFASAVVNLVVDFRPVTITISV
jgi:hypothetical protein